MAPEERERAVLAGPDFVGRKRELGVLGAALAAGAALVLMEGEAGVGKSRLLREFLSSGAGARQRALVAACPPFREPYTLGGIVEALRQASPDVAGLNLTTLGGALRPLFPEWSGQLPPALPASEDARAARYQLYGALAELFDRFGVSILVVEDAHWADEATLELAVFLAARRPGSLSLVVTYRPEEVPEGSLLLRLSSRPAAGALPTRVTLSALGLQETAALVSSMLRGATVSGDFAGFLYARTDGLPLAVEESVRLLFDREDLTWDAGRWARRYIADLDVPPTYRDSVLERAGRLPAGPAALLEAAAVIAEPIAAATLLALCGLPSAQGSEDLVSAVGSGLLREQPPGMISFRHALAARAVYDAAPAPRRRELHQRAGELLAAASPQPTAQVARHFREAGDTGNLLRYAERAADAALAAGDEATAGRLLHELVTGAGLDSATVARLTGKIPFSSLNGEPQWRELVAALRATLAAGPDSPAVEAEVRLQLGLTLHLLEEYGPALEELARALPALDGESPEVAWLLSLLGWPIGTEWPVAVHREWLRRSARVMKTAQASMTAGERLRWSMYQTAGLLLTGDEDGWRQAAAIPDDAGSLVENRRIVLIHYNAAEDAIIWGRLAEARRRLELAGRLIERHEVERMPGLIQVTDLRLDWLTGAWDGLLDRALELARDREIRLSARLHAELVAGYLLAAGGAHAEAVRILESAYAQAQPRTATPEQMGCAAALARLRLSAGCVDEALTLTQEPTALLERKGTWLWATELLPVRVEALIAAGEDAEAVRLTEAYRAGIRGVDACAPAAGVALCEAIIAASPGLFATAARAWQAVPRPYDAALARERQGRGLLGAGDREAGVRALQAVREQFAALGATWHAEHLAGVLRQHGVAAEPVRRTGRKGYGNRLSPREAEVVKLVRAGKTNPQIAAELHRSPSTVATQLQSAMRKLGVSSRTALAVAAQELA